jgi:hypothetical protein
LNAVMKPQWQRLLTTLIDQVKHGAPLELMELEPDECVKWIAEESEDQLGSHMLDAMSDAYVTPKIGNRYDTLCAKLMVGTMTADELCEWRDMHRAALIDMCSKWARKKVEEETL